MNWKQNPYVRLMRLDKPVGNFLLLWPTLWALWLAGEGKPDVLIVVVFILGVFLMRAAGCVINDYADRKVDGKVKRTVSRPLATGELSEKHALALFFSLVMLSFLLVLTMNWQTILLSFTAVFLAIIYPFMKRYTHFPQVFLGAAFGWAIPMVYMATQQTIPAEAWLLFMANLCWVLAYDTIYAMADYDDDIKAGIKSTAVLFGRWNSFWIAIFQFVFLAIMVLLGFSYQLGMPYFLGLSFAACFAVYHQTLIYHRQPKRCFKAFLNNNILGAIIFSGLFLNYLL